MAKPNEGPPANPTEASASRAPRCLGQAKGKWSIPVDIDKDNELIADLFEGRSTGGLCDRGIAALKTDMVIMKWIMGFVLAFQVAIFVKLFIQ
jgi:hypothetical protein